VGASVYGKAGVPGRECAASGGAITLGVYGLPIVIEGDWPEVVDSLARDFAWFARDQSDPVTPRVLVRIVRRNPEPERFGEVAQAFITSRNTVFQSGARTIVDYSGRALAVYDRIRESFVVEGEEDHLVHEAAYLFLLSRIGRHLDHSRLTRLHALALSVRQGAVLLLLPSGGGKTTLALRALREDDVKLISEDTPVLDRHGMVHPFPLRIGVNESDADLLPADGEVHRIERLEYGPKLLLSTASFADRIEHEPRPLRHLVLGRRWLSGGGSLAPLPRRALIGPLIRDGVVGVGVAQMIEYVLRQGTRDFLGQGGVAAGRALTCARALAGAQAWRLELGREQQRNWEALAPLLR
jgi:hypothetical protein